MSDPTHLIIVDSGAKLLMNEASRYIVRAQDYIANDLPAEIAGKHNLRVINLCSDYGYLNMGYYCSLLADARGHRCIPGTSDIVHTNWKRIHKISLPELEQALNNHLDDAELPAEADFFFGRTEHEPLVTFGRKLFDVFRLPMMRLAFLRKDNKWKIKEVEALALSDLGDKVQWFNECLNQYTGSYWNTKKTPQDKYWLAILYNPDDPMGPSNERALKKFIQAGKKKRFYVELITKNNLDSLLEYDALFIRETTNVNHHTYRFAQKAESEGIPCIDDTMSILRCCNKVYLHELLKSKKIGTPRTYFINRRQKELSMPDESDYPLVIKVPDGSFSLGVFKVYNAEEYSQKVQELFKKSELLLVQEFLPSAFDWRIVLLGGEPLFACRYHMAKKHWQIYNHNTKNKSNQTGNADCVPLEKVPKKVLQTAIRSANLIGDGLYGVDIKEIEGVPYVIEINDNPSIDAGVEDQILGDRLYEAILEHFQYLIDK
jgi:glutathione synthase/RimK-type ligase-like ATP-grasp enzyme